MAGVTDRGPVWLGIDVGTQSVRCVATDRTGVVVASGSGGLRDHRDGDRHEQDPHDWWAALTEASQKAMVGVGSRPVRGVALCATSGTILLADSRGEPLSAGLMYDDTRAVPQTQRAVAAGLSLWHSLGYRPQPSWALPKLLWLLTNTPPADGVRLLHQADYLTGRLTGRRTAVDSSHALKTGYDVASDRWPVEVFEALGVPVEVLPEVVRPGSGLGEVAPETGTGIPAGTPVIAGMTDGCAALLGSGTLDAGSWNSVLGTTLVLKGVTEHRLRDPLGAVYSHRAPDGRWLPGGASSAGAGVLTAEFAGRDLVELDAKATDRPHATTATYPLVSRGERFPFVAAEAERFTLGEADDEIDRYAAVLRGVAFVERLCLDYLDLLGAPTGGTLSLTGGGARSGYWCQLRADTLGQPVRVPRDSDPAAGMALLARAGRTSLADAAGELAREQVSYEPDPAAYGVLTDGYLAMVDALRGRGWLPAELAGHAVRRSGRWQAT